MSDLDTTQRHGEGLGSGSQASAATTHGGPQAVIAQRLVATHGRSIEALAAGVRASGSARDPTLWLALHQLLGMALTRQVQALADAASSAAPGATDDAAREPSPPPPGTTATNAPATAAAPAPPPHPVSLVARDVTILGVRVVAPAGTHADVIERCRAFIEPLLSRSPAMQERMQRSRVTIVVIPVHTRMTDLPQFRSLRGDDTFDGRDWSTVRGSGGTRAPDGSWSVGVAEEAIVQIPGASTYPAGYSMGMHELAHTLQSKGLTGRQRSRLNELYRDHRRRDANNAGGTWTDNYAAATDDEYFAQATNAFFGTNNMPGNQNGRDWLRMNDPQMYAFLVEVYESPAAEAEREPG
jgi:hypothetical protein